MKKGILLSSIILLTLLIGVFIYFFYNRYSLTWAFLIKPLNRFETKEKIVALTFDDGPHARWTPLLLDLFKKYSVKATFFVVGEDVEKNRGVVQRALREGHQIGNHTYKHDIMVFHSYSFVKNDLKKADGVLLDAGVHDISFFRPPTGEKMIVLPLVLKNMNKTLVMWDVHPPTEKFISWKVKDSKFLSQYVTDISQYTIDNCQPGSIILLHDGWHCNLGPFLEAVERIIIGLKNKGYRFVTIQEGINITGSGG